MRGSRRKFCDSFEVREREGSAPSTDGQVIIKRQMNCPNIDAAILAVAQTTWQKVAMIIAKAANQLGGNVPEGDDRHELIAQRIAALVAAGRLVAQGDIRLPRHSEVRLP